VTGGFAEISASGVSVLAELAVPVAEATTEMVDKLLAEATKVSSDAAGKDAADKTIADLTALKAALAAH
jgi:F-type H+-transporting ATPase subunit epsilon